MSKKKQYGFRVDVQASQHVLVAANDEFEAVHKLHDFYRNEMRNGGVWSYEINKGPTDRYEDINDVRLIRPKEY